MANTWADNVDTVVDDQQTMPPEKGQEIPERTPPLQLPAPAPCPHTVKPDPQSRKPETHPLGGQELLGLLMAQKHRPVAPPLRDAEAEGNTSDVNMNQHLLSQSAGGDCLPDVLLPDILLADVPHLQACPEGSVGEE